MDTAEESNADGLEPTESSCTHSNEAKIVSEKEKCVREEVELKNNSQQTKSFEGFSQSDCSARATKDCSQDYDSHSLPTNEEAVTNPQTNLNSPNTQCDSAPEGETNQKQHAGVENGFPVATNFEPSPCEDVEGHRRTSISPGRDLSGADAPDSRCNQFLFLNSKTPTKNGQRPLTRQPKIERSLSECPEEEEEDNCVEESCGNGSARKRNTAFGRKIIKSIIRSSSFNERPSRDPPRHRLLRASESDRSDTKPDTGGGCDEVFIEQTDQLEDLNNKNVRTKETSNTRRLTRRLMVSHSVDHDHCSLSGSEKPDEDKNLPCSSPPHSIPSSKRSKQHSLNSLFSSGLDYFSSGSSIGVLSKRLAFAQRSMSTACENPPAPVKAASSTSSLTSFANAEGEDVLSKLPKFSRIRVPSTKGLAAGKLTKLSSKNCYRLVILGSSKVGKSSLVSR